MSIANGVIDFSHSLKFLGQCLNLFVKLLFFMRGLFLRVGEIQMELLILSFKLLTDSLKFRYGPAMTGHLNLNPVFQVSILVLQLMNPVLTFLTFTYQLLVLDG